MIYRILAALGFRPLTDRDKLYISLHLIGATAVMLFGRWMTQ